MTHINVRNCEITLISIHTLPAFLKPITNKYSYFNSTGEYAKQYLEQELKYENDENFPQIEYDTNKVSDFYPMDEYHTLHSFWKAFRLPMMKGIEKKESYDKFAFFLPLRFDLDVPQISGLNGANSSLRAYVFPFGGVALQLSVQIDDIFFESLTPTIQKLRKNLIIDNMRFDDYSHDIAKKLSREITGNDIVESFDSHNFVFIYETQPPLIYREGETNDKRIIERRIIGILNHRPVNQVTDDNDLIRDELKYKFEGRTPRPDELIYFKPNTSFVYPSPTWVTSLKLENKSAREVEHKLDCMRHNYLSFITVISSLNRFLKAIIAMHRTPEMDVKIHQFYECMNSFIRSDDLESCLINNKRNLKTISDAISFKRNIDEFRQLVNGSKLGTNR